MKDFDKKYEIINEIGKGAYNNIYLIIDKKTHINYVLKQLMKDECVFKEKINILKNKNI